MSTGSGRDINFDDADVQEDVRDSGKVEFDCPQCTANNPTETALIDRQEIICNYCGTEYRVMMTDGGRFKLKEL